MNQIYNICHKIYSILFYTILIYIKHLYYPIKTLPILYLHLDDFPPFSQHKSVAELRWDIPSVVVCSWVAESSYPHRQRQRCSGWWTRWTNLSMDRCFSRPRPQKKNKFSRCLEMLILRILAVEWCLGFYPFGVCDGTRENWTRKPGNGQVYHQRSDRFM